MLTLGSRAARRAGSPVGFFRDTRVVDRIDLKNPAEAAEGRAGVLVSIDEAVHQTCRLMRDPTIRRFEGRAKRTGPRVEIPVPFDPGDVWGRRDRYHVTGTVNGARFRGPLVSRDGSWLIQRGPKSGAAAVLADGDAVTVEIWPEGPQIEELADDITEALRAHPRAKAAFEGLAQFYRNGWLRWIDATKRRPDIRKERIAEMLRLLESGHKERR